MTFEHIEFVIMIICCGIALRSQHLFFAVLSKVPSILLCLSYNLAALSRVVFVLCMNTSKTV